MPTEYTKNFDKNNIYEFMASCISAFFYNLTPEDFINDKREYFLSKIGKTELEFTETLYKNAIEKLANIKKYSPNEYANLERERLENDKKKYSDKIIELEKLKSKASSFKEKINAINFPSQYNEYKNFLIRNLDIIIDHDCYCEMDYEMLNFINKTLVNLNDNDYVNDYYNNEIIKAEYEISSYKKRIKELKGNTYKHREWVNGLFDIISKFKKSNYE